MGQERSAGGTAVGGGAEQIRREIEETREQLGETVEALSEKTDVKAQARRKVQQTKARALELAPESAASAASDASRRARENPATLATVGVFAAGFLLGRITRR